MFSSPESTNRGVTPELLATILLVLAYIVWILSLPAWPSQDGPVHLYYVHVMRELLSHHATVYSRYYTIKHVLPPYALYYYALLALSKFCSLLLADRLVLCVYLILFVFGFRYLARAVGPSADLSTLLALLLALNWSAGMGFLNHCLSLALVFWAIGLWLRFTERRPGARLVFLLIVAAITLTHPVPYSFCSPSAQLIGCSALYVGASPAETPGEPFLRLILWSFSSRPLGFSMRGTSPCPTPCHNPGLCTAHIFRRLGSM
jgi:hypothetical protein